MRITITGFYTERLDYINEELKKQLHKRNGRDKRLISKLLKEKESLENIIKLT